MTVINCENTCTLDQSIQANQNSNISLLTRVWTMLKRLSTAMSNRRCAEKLNYATDFELADLGLRREDLYIINHSRMFDDPTVELQRRAHENTRGLKSK